MNLSYAIQKLLKKIFNRPCVNNTKMDRTSKVDVGSTVVQSSIGKYSYIGEHTSVLYTSVGAFSSISNYCAIGGGSHPIDWVSTSPVFNSSKGIVKKKFSKNEYVPFKETRIGNDVWIGSHCLIKSGVSIGDGAVIGMGSVITKDVGAYEIWAGVPAHFIRKRFKETVIQELIDIQWWNFDEEKLTECAHCFNSVDDFLKWYWKGE